MKPTAFFILLIIVVMTFSSCNKETIPVFSDTFSFTLDGKPKTWPTSQTWSYSPAFGSKDFLAEITAWDDQTNQSLTIYFPHQQSAISKGKTFNKDGSGSSNQVSIDYQQSDSGQGFDTWSSDSLSGEASVSITYYDFDEGIEGEFEFRAYNSLDSSVVTGESGTFSLNFED